tara:strand:+ start:1175 stop:1360 length:186 start_codon:yes stop_codon:yes gene_type:complete
MISPLITNSFVTLVGSKRHPMNTGVSTSIKKVSGVGIGRDIKAIFAAFIIKRNLNETTTYH